MRSIDPTVAPHHLQANSDSFVAVGVRLLFSYYINKHDDHDTRAEQANELQLKLMDKNTLANG